ncbi:MAG: helix-turn-helix domain-containing protein [Myxococcaceae bacterium]
MSRRAGPARGVLNPRPEGDFEHERLLPAEPLAPFIAHYWWVRWRVKKPARVETLPHPSFHLTFESQRARWELGGVHRRRFVRDLSGAGFVFGVKLRPAMAVPWLVSNAAALAGKVVPFARSLPTGEWPTIHEAIAAVEPVLLERLRRPDATALRLRDLVERAETDRTLVRVAQLGRDVRTLQRRFLKYVGVAPKWVLQRYRLHEAAEQLRAHPETPLAELALNLGYADQAHFARDFKATVGRSPKTFALTSRTSATGR